MMTADTTSAAGSANANARPEKLATAIPLSAVCTANAPAITSAHDTWEGSEYSRAYAASANTPGETAHGKHTSEACAKGAGRWHRQYLHMRLGTRGTASH